MAKIKNLFSTPNLVALITGLLLFSLAPQQPIHERFSLLERVAPALALLLLSLYVRKQEVKQWILPIPILLLLLIMAISIAQMPVFFVVKDFIAFALLTLFAIMAVSAVGINPAINGAAISLGLLVFTTCFYALFLPDKAYEPLGQLKGAFYGENSLPLSLLLLSPALCVIHLRSNKFTYAVRGVILTSIFFIIFFSTSRTSLLVFILMLLSWGLFQLFKRNFRAGIAAASSISLGVILVVFNWDTFTSALGKSADLSGRFPLWNAYLEAIFMKPVVGYGWHVRTTTDMPLGDFIVRTTGYPQINANNDLLNWWALTGVMGALLALISVFFLITNGIRNRNRSSTSTWIFLTGTVLLLAGFSELSTMHPDGWLLMSLAFVGSFRVDYNQQSAPKPLLSSGLLTL